MATKVTMHYTQFTNNYIPLKAYFLNSDKHCPAPLWPFCDHGDIYKCHNLLT